MFLDLGSDQSSNPSHVRTVTGDGDVLASSLSWHISKDSALIAMADTKTITTIPDVVCKVAGDRGVMEVRVVDHNLAAKVEVWVLS